MKKYLFLGLLILLTVSCTERKGTFEKAGEKVDEGIHKAEDKMDEGVKKVDDKIDDLKKGEDKPHVRVEGHL